MFILVVTIYKTILSKYVFGSKKGRFMENDFGLMSIRLLHIIRRIFWIRSGDNFDGFVEQLTAKFSDFVSFVVGVVVVHVTNTLDGSQLQSEIVAESPVVASFGHLVALLYFAEAVVQQNDLVAGLLEAPFSFRQGKTFVEWTHGERFLLE